MENNDTTLATLAVGAPIVAQGLALLGQGSPAQVFLVAGVCALLQIYSTFANKKSSDFMQQFIDHKDQLVPEIVQSDKFIAVFLDLFERNIKESNEEKRQLIKNYILNMATGIESDFNEHTKLINVLNTISLEEIEMLRLFDEGGPIEWDRKAKAPMGGMHAYTLSDISQAVRNSKIYSELELNLNFDRQSGNNYNRILLSLGYKDLLFALGQDNFGSGEEAKVRDITSFGKTFLRFIKA